MWNNEHAQDRCSDCGGVVKEGERVCRICGASIERASEQTEEIEYECSECGATVSPEQLRCPTCGANLHEEEPTGSEIPMATEQIAPGVSVDPARRLFTERAIGVATGLGGPLAGAYLLSKNFRFLGEDGAARTSLNVGIIVTIVLVLLAAIVPSQQIYDRLLGSLLPVVLGGIGYLVVRRYQDNDIKAHLAAGGRRGSWASVIGASLVSIAILFTLGFALGLVLAVAGDDADDAPFAGTSVRCEPSGCLLYYDSTISRSDTKVIAVLLQDMGYFRKETDLPAGFHRQDGIYTVELLAEEKNWNHPGIIHDVRLLLSVLKEQYPQRQFAVELVSIDELGRRTSKSITGE